MHIKNNKRQCKNHFEDYHKILWLQIFCCIICNIEGTSGFSQFPIFPVYIT